MSVSVFKLETVPEVIFNFFTCVINNKCLGWTIFSGFDRSQSLFHFVALSQAGSATLPAILLV